MTKKLPTTVIHTLGAFSVTLDLATLRATHVTSRCEGYEFSIELDGSETLIRIGAELFDNPCLIETFTVVDAEVLHHVVMQGSKYMIDKTLTQTLDNHRNHYRDKTLRRARRGMNLPTATIDEPDASEVIADAWNESYRLYAVHADNPRGITGYTLSPLDYLNPLDAMLGQQIPGDQHCEVKLLICEDNTAETCGHSTLTELAIIDWDVLTGESEHDEHVLKELAHDVVTLETLIMTAPVPTITTS